MKFCTNCGKKNKQEAVFCESCGQSLTGGTETTGFSKPGEVKREGIATPPPNNQSKKPIRLKKWHYIALVAVLLLGIVGKFTYDKKVNTPINMLAQGIINLAEVSSADVEVEFQPPNGEATFTINGGYQLGNNLNNSYSHLEMEISDEEESQTGELFLSGRELYANGHGNFSNEYVSFSRKFEFEDTEIILNKLVDNGRINTEYIGDLVEEFIEEESKYSEDELSPDEISRLATYFMTHYIQKSNVQNKLFEINEVKRNREFTLSLRYSDFMQVFLDYVNELDDNPKQLEKLDVSKKVFSEIVSSFNEDFSDNYDEFVEEVDYKILISGQLDKKKRLSQLTVQIFKKEEVTFEADLSFTNINKTTIDVDYIKEELALGKSKEEEDTYDDDNYYDDDDDYYDDDDDEYYYDSDDYYDDDEYY